MKTLKIWISSLILVAVSLVSVAQGWRVKDFKATVQMNADGTLNVTEDITVQFDESKRGIIRKLPYRYYQSNVADGETAFGHTPGQDYLTPIDEFVVEENVYSVTKTEKDYEIKVGQSDVYLSGEQHYAIKYKVYGAVNFFSDHVELYWNANGNDWDVEFDNLSLTVLLPDDRKVKEDDILVYTGAVGSTFNNSATKTSPGRVEVIASRRLNAKEGLTAVIRFPKGYVNNAPIPLNVRADWYVIDSLIAEMQVLDNGVVEVEEWMYIDLISPQADVVRVLDRSYLSQVHPALQPWQISYEAGKAWSMKSGGTELPESRTLEGYGSSSSEFKITFSGSSFTEPGKYRIRHKYKVWMGSVSDRDVGSATYLPWCSASKHEPIAYARARLRWRTPQAPDPKYISQHATTEYHGQPRLDATSLSLSWPTPPMPGAVMHFGMVFPGKQFMYSKMPLHVFEPDAYYSWYHVDLEVQPSGWVMVTNKFVYTSDWFITLRRPFRQEYSSWDETCKHLARPQLWGTKGEYLVRNLQADGELQDYYAYADHSLDLKGPEVMGYTGEDTLSYSYKVFGFIDREGGADHLRMNLLEMIEQAADSVSFSIRIPGNASISPGGIQVAAFSQYSDSGFANIKFRFEEGGVDGWAAGGLISYQGLRLDLSLPPGLVSTPFGTTLKLLWVNHKAVFLPLLFLIPLLIAWFIAGRNKRFTTVVEFYPPEDMTPTEAGLLIDDKLHNRDLLALIYYWGAQGLMTMEEVFDSDGKAVDYKFTKLQELPKNARKYEKTIFNGLFTNGNITKVSSQRQKFYTYLLQARTEVDTHARARNFYVPGTMGWSNFLRFTGWVLAIVAVIALGMVVFEATLWMRGRWEIPAAWGLSAALFIFFGRIMPRRGPYGQKQYQKLIGFREFILRAEKDKLEQLLNTNPDYFGMTLPYAIALGIATKWAERFGDLLQVPPTYYKTDPSHSDFRLNQFNLMMQRQLDQMAHSFNSRPPAPKGGGGGWGGGSSSGGGSSYRSSSSYSSSSSSGSSGFSSGGGYSGGGYGGGGGSAW